MTGKNEPRGQNSAESSSVAPGARQTFATIAGFGCLLAWNYVTFFSRTVHYSTRNDISHLNSTYTFACCGMILVMLLVALPWPRLLQRAASEPGSEQKPSSIGALLLSNTTPLVRDDRRTSLVVAVALACSAMTVVLEMVESYLFTQPWCSIASTIAGGALGLLYLFWAQRLTRWSRASVPWRVVASFCVGASLFVITLMLPLSVAHVAVVLLPLASAALYIVSDTTTQSEQKAAHPASEERSVTSLPRRGQMFWRALVVVAMLGFAESLARALFLEISPVEDTLTYQWVLFGAVLIASTVLLASTVGRRGPRAITTVSHVVAFAMAFLILLAPIVKGMGLLADLATMVCYALFYLLLWTLLAQTVIAYRLPVTVGFGLGLGLAFAGCLAGTFVGSLLTSFVDIGWRSSCLLALGCACIVHASLMFVVDDRTIVALLDADDERPSSPRRFMLRCEQLADAHGLTPRETEVMVLIAKGRSAQKIQEMLGLSAGTVNTYLVRIYKKLGIHARQDLLDLLDEDHGSPMY